ncbi:hypothetical protein [Micromonospora sp. DT227]|uniref:hypothetical protein n=1 Tax=Micromonospora sp. DT227 TaxID=3393433 RepID=UPI003CF77DFC
MRRCRDVTCRPGWRGQRGAAAAPPVHVRNGIHVRHCLCHGEQALVSVDRRLVLATSAGRPHTTGIDPCR